MCDNKLVIDTSISLMPCLLNHWDDSLNKQNRVKQKATQAFSPKHEVELRLQYTPVSYARVYVVAAHVVGSLCAAI